MKKWEKLDSKIVFEHPRITVSEHKVKLPDGTITDYAVFDSFPEYSTVIGRNEQGDFLFVEDPAYPINELLLQFPEGVPNKGESLVIGARRELLEETGYRANELIEIGKTLSHHRRSSAYQHTFLAESVELEDEMLERDAEEQGMQIRWLTEDEVWTLIADGTIKQKNTLAAWSFYQAYRRRS